MRRSGAKSMRGQGARWRASLFVPESTHSRLLELTRARSRRWAAGLAASQSIRLHSYHRSTTARPSRERCERLDAYTLSPDIPPILSLHEPGPPPFLTLLTEFRGSRENAHLSESIANTPRPCSLPCQPHVRHASSLQAHGCGIMATLIADRYQENRSDSCSLPRQDNTQRQVALMKNKTRLPKWREISTPFHPEWLMSHCVTDRHFVWNNLVPG